MGSKQVIIRMSYVLALSRPGILLCQINGVWLQPFLSLVASGNGPLIQRNGFTLV